MKHKSSIISFAILAALLVSCGTIKPIDPNADAFVVNSERTVQSAFDTVDGFQKFVSDNRLLIVTKAPALYDAALAIQKEAPPVFRDAWASIDLYKGSKTTNNVDKVKASLKVVDDLLLRAQAKLLEAKGVK